MKGKIMISAWIEEKLLEKFDNVAEKENRTRSNMIEVVMKDFVEKK
jgi:metal-responsive CopG/Arc/MetJ family transcriptional regulator